MNDNELADTGETHDGPEPTEAPQPDADAPALDEGEVIEE